MFNRRKKKVELPEDVKQSCMVIIHGAAAACGATGTGLAQIPLADNAVITPIQVGMIIALGQVFELSITESVARGIITGAGASLIGRGVSQVLWGWIPVVGNAINTATAAGLTEAIGWMAVDQFAREANNRTEPNRTVHPNNDEAPPSESAVETNHEDEYESFKERVEEFVSGRKNPDIDSGEYDILENELTRIIDRTHKDKYKELYGKLTSL